MRRLPRDWPGWLFLIVWLSIIALLIIFGAAQATDCANLNADFCERIIWD